MGKVSNVGEYRSSMNSFGNTEDNHSIGARKIDQESMNTDVIDHDGNFSPADVSKLRQENAEIKKEMQAMESKLKSNMKSIKSFWSPELKKEKAARIEQGDRYLALQEKYMKLTSEAQELEKSLETEKSKVRELQGGNSIASERSSANTKETVSVLIERIKELENEVLVLQQLVDSKEVAMNKLEDSFLTMEAEKETSQMQKMLDALSRVTHLEEDIASKEQTIVDLQDELELSKSQSMLANELQDILGLKDEELTKVSDNCQKLQEELTDLKHSSNEHVSNEEKKYKENLKKKEEVFESHSKFMKSKLESLKGELAKKDTELTAAETKVETFEKHQSDLQEHISVLHSSNKSKESHIQNLQQELRSVRDRLDEKEKLLGDKEKEVSSLSSLQFQNSGEVDVLNSLMQSKEKQIASLKKKCVGLENELSDKIQLLSSSRSQATSMESELSAVNSTVKTLQKTVKEKELRIANMEQKNDHLIEEHEKETQNLQQRLDLLQTKVLKNEVALQDKLDELESIRSHSVQKEYRATTLEKSIRDKDSDLDDLKMNIKRKDEELKKMSSEVSRREMDFEKVKEECDGLTKELSEFAGKNNSLSNEIREKNEKLEDLEKQLKEQVKKVANSKRNQQLERERHATLLNEMKQQLDQTVSNQSETKNQLEAKTERVAILEEALQETVNTVSENECLLGEQAHKSYELEVELANIKIENTVTNTKNASLILSLSQRDIALTYYRNERKRMMAEVLEMKQNALLATISEKDANVAILEQNPTIQGEQEVRKLKAEKDHLVDQLKQLNQKRVLILSDDSNNMTVSTELSQGTKETITESLVLLGSNTEKLLFYMDSLADVMKEHYKEIYKTLPRSPSPKEGKLSINEEATHSELVKEVESLVVFMQSAQHYVEIMLENLEETELEQEHDHDDGENTES